VRVDDTQEPPSSGTELCRADDVPDRQGKEFVFGGPLGFRMFVVRRGDEFFGYVNQCPHMALTLNLMPDRFVGLDQEHIVCANHGASFRVEDGFCDYGPCVGQSLTPIPIELRSGTLVIGVIGS
jgi:nitrite reductase/ring-hydroxylating ferredoxin subunit